MSSESTPVRPAVLVTIISEGVLKDRLMKLLKSKGVSGYTVTPVQGEGGHGRRMGDMNDIIGYNTNIEIKTLVSPEASDDLLQTIAEMRNGHALIAFRQNVDALYD